MTALLGTAVEASVTDQAGNFTGVSAGLTSGISLGLPLMSMMALDTDDSSLAQVSSLSSEQLDTGESTDVQSLHVSSKMAAATLSETQTIDNNASTEVENSVYAIGGVVINLADGSVQTGQRSQAARAMTLSPSQVSISHTSTAVTASIPCFSMAPRSIWTSRRWG